MRGSYYADSGCILIQIPAPPFLVEHVNERSRALGLTKREIFRGVLRDFLRRHGDRIPTCHATYKKPDAPKIRIWVEPEIAEPLKVLAARSHVTLRAMVYTALVMKLGDARRERAAPKVEA